MKTFDVFYTAEDAHKVRPLIRFLELQDVGIRQNTSPKPVASSPHLVVVSEHFQEEAWAAEALEAADAIALLLADAEVPPETRTADLRAWPARSADRTLASVAEWIKSPQAGSASQASAAKRTGVNPQRRQNIAAVSVLVMLLAGLVWLGSREGSQEEPAEDLADQARESADQGLRQQREIERPIARPEQLTAADGISPAERIPLTADFQTERYLCLRRWQLDGPIAQCWVSGDLPISWNPPDQPAA